MLGVPRLTFGRAFIGQFNLQTTKQIMKKYTATFILDTRSYNDPVETLVDNIKGVMESVGCKIESVENMGQRTFVRTPDRKFPAGIYVQVKFEGPSNANSQIKEKLRLDKTVDRILVLAD